MLSRTTHTKTRSRLEILGPLAISFVLAVAGIAMLAWASRDYASYREARRSQLEAVSGTLTLIRMDEPLFGRAGHPRRTITVEYEYEFGGRSFTGARLAYGSTKWSALLVPQAESIVEEIQSQDPLIVYVDRRDPARSVLISEKSGILGIGTFALTFGGVVFGLLFGVAWFVQQGIGLMRSRKTTS